MEIFLDRISPRSISESAGFGPDGDRSDPFEPFAPPHTVQAAFTAHGVPWEEFLLLMQLLPKNVKLFKVDRFPVNLISPLVNLFHGISIENLSVKLIQLLDNRILIVGID